jgi:hypothetical protein
MKNSDFVQSAFDATAEDDIRCYARAHTYLPTLFLLFEEGLSEPLALHDSYMQELVREAVFLRFLIVRTLIVRAFYKAVNTKIPDDCSCYVENVPLFMQAGLLAHDEQEDFCAMLHLAYTLGCLREHFEVTPQEFFKDITSFLPQIRTWSDRARTVKFT